MLNRSIFLVTALANILTTATALLLAEKSRSEYHTLIGLLLELIASPFQAVFYCTFNYYLQALASDHNAGTIFGVAYSTFALKSLAAVAFILYQERISTQTGFFQYPSLVASAALSFLYLVIKEPLKLDEKDAREEPDSLDMRLMQ